MYVLSRDELPLGGFAGLKEHRIVTDSRVFGARKSPSTSEGIGNFVYLADAQFDPKGETGMHPHKEIDVISVMVQGRVSHEGSLEHGKSLEQGDVQVQRAGGEGFSHNEINPDETRNRMIQLWVLPDEPGQPAGYKYYRPSRGRSNRIYGGDKSQSDTFDSGTQMEILHLEQNQRIEFSGETLVYVYAGNADFKDSAQLTRVNDGDLVRGREMAVQAIEATSMIVISESA